MRNMVENMILETQTDILLDLVNNCTCFDKWRALNDAVFAYQKIRHFLITVSYNSSFGNEA